MHTAANVLFIAGTVIIIVGMLSQGIQLFPGTQNRPIDPSNYEEQVNQRKQQLKRIRDIYKSPSLWIGVCCILISILLSSI